MKANIIKRTSISNAGAKEKRLKGMSRALQKIDVEITRLSTLWEHKMNLLSKARAAKDEVAERKLSSECAVLSRDVSNLSAAQRKLR